MSFALGELAVRFGCELRGDPALRVARVATLAHAGPEDLSFLANPQYRQHLASTRAGVVVLDAASAALFAGAALISPNPYATYARMAALLQPNTYGPPGVHPAAVVAASAQVAGSASVGALCVIGERCRIGERVQMGPGCVLGADVEVAADCRLAARVSLGDGVRLAERVRVHSGAVIGADGFGFAREGVAWIGVPQLGTVRVGADADIGANTTIDRGAIEDTLIGEGVKLDNQIQVAHNVHIGAHTVIAACTGISGSTHIGARCMIAGAVGIVGHLEICDDVVVTGMSMVTRSISVPGIYSGGIPAEPARLWRRLVGRWRRLERTGRGGASRSGVGKAASNAQDGQDE